MSTLKELRHSIRLYQLALRHFSTSSGSSAEAFRQNSTAPNTDTSPSSETADSNSNDGAGAGARDRYVFSDTNSAGTSGLQEKHPWVGRIIYNTYLSSIDGTPRGFRERRRRMEVLPNIMEQRTVQAHRDTIPVALQMVFKDAGVELPQQTPHEELDVENFIPRCQGSKIQFPYRLLTSMGFTSQAKESDGFADPVAELEEQPIRRRRRNREAPVKAEEEESSIDYEWYKDYGTPNSSIPPSNVPCGGCGAVLHCQDTSIAGYMPSERFQCLSSQDLLTEICQRCYFLKEHKAALNVNISREDYPRILSQIKDKFALVLLLVDLLDFPCSIWPEIIDIIGTRRPVILVGNKVDLLPQDSPKFLRHVRKCLLKTCKEVGLNQANVIHTELVSATTGYGIEQLIDAVFHRWHYRGDVYIMGCTNVGKSSLFNTFLQSDLCKIRVVDIIQRATISQWPGTTLNLLKFPMTRPSTERMGVRAARLREERYVSTAAHRELRKVRVRDNRTIESSTLIGHIGQSFVDKERIKRIEQMNTHRDLFHVSSNLRVRSKPHVLNKMKSREELEEEFKLSRWCFDTPGAVADNQILDQLTLPELMQTLPKQIIEPRTYLLRVGWTMFLAGLARVDYLNGAADIRLTVFTIKSLPITIVLTEDADQVYKEGLGSIVFGVPFGNEERIAQFPPLKGVEFELDGDGHKASCADIVISSTGWIAVTAGLGEDILLKAFTPNAKGLFCRKPALLPYTVNLKGKRIQGTPAYNPTRVFVES